MFLFVNEMEDSFVGIKLSFKKKRKIAYYLVKIAQVLIEIVLFLLRLSTFLVKLSNCKQSYAFQTKFTRKLSSQLKLSPLTVSTISSVIFLGFPTRLRRRKFAASSSAFLDWSGKFSFVLRVFKFLPFFNYIYFHLWAWREISFRCLRFLEGKRCLKGPFKTVDGDLTSLMLFSTQRNPKQMSRKSFKNQCGNRKFLIFIPRVADCHFFFLLSMFVVNPITKHLFMNETWEVVSDLKRNKRR